MTGINDGNNNITVCTRGFFKVEVAAMHQEVRPVLVRQLFMKRDPGTRGAERGVIGYSRSVICAVLVCAAPRV